MRIALLPLRTPRTVMTTGRALVVIPFASLPACNAGTGSATAVFVSSSGPGGSPPNGPCGARVNVPAQFTVDGSGVCEVVRLHFGDGQAVDGDNIDFSKPWTVSHTYAGWPGLKTLTVEAVANCVSTATGSI